MKYRYLLLCLFLPLFSHAQRIAYTPEKFAVVSGIEMPACRSYFSRGRESGGGVSWQADKALVAREKVKGRPFMVLGSILFTGGAILYLASDRHVSIYLNESKGNGMSGAADQQAEAGVLLAAVGAGFFVPGVIIYSKGKREREASASQKTVSLHTAGAGLSLRLKL
jgi:hypothetical protein